MDIPGSFLVGDNGIAVPLQDLRVRCRVLQRMKVLPEHLLLKCTQCEAWPMAIVADEDDRLTFSVRPVQGAGILQGWSRRVACACSSGTIPARATVALGRWVPHIMRTYHHGDAGRT
jgi:hypothetical protein